MFIGVCLIVAGGICGAPSLRRVASTLAPLVRSLAAQSQRAQPRMFQAVRVRSVPWNHHEPTVRRDGFRHRASVGSMNPPPLESPPSSPVPRYLRFAGIVLGVSGLLFLLGFLTDSSPKTGFDILSSVLPALLLYSWQGSG